MKDRAVLPEIKRRSVYEQAAFCFNCIQEGEKEHGTENK